jgi:anti-sigma B factor antagonist
MTLTERAAGPVTIIDVDGKVTVTDANQLRDKVRSLLQQGRMHLIVNLAHVPYMDSAGLGELVQAYATVTRQGGALKLLNTTSKLRDLLVITKLATIFESFDSEAGALASFGARA